MDAHLSPVAWEIEQRETGWPAGRWEHSGLVYQKEKPNKPPSPNGAYEYRSRALVYTRPSVEGEGARAALAKIDDREVWEDEHGICRYCFGTAVDEHDDVCPVYIARKALGTQETE